jgi:hypothetical protein
MRRYQLIELHEQEWMPRLLRESFVESLSAVLRMTGVYRGAAPLFARWLQATGCREVLDLASGAAGPTEALIGDLRGLGVEPPRFCLSDLFPSESKFERVRDAHPGYVSFISEPVDALRVSPPLGRELRQIVSAFHHFRPEQARLILQDAVDHSRGICILEPFQRDGRHLLLAALSFFPALLAPFYARERRLRLLLTTLLLPVVPLMLVFDALVSVLRSYTGEEMKAMVQSLKAENFQWSVGSTRFLLFFRATYLFGWKQAGTHGQ